MRYFWSDKIEFKILNPEVDCGWVAKEGGTLSPARASLIQSARRVTLFLLRRLLSQTKRNRKLDISNILQCPKCGNSKFLRKECFLICRGCNCEIKAYLSEENFQQSR